MTGPYRESDTAAVDCPRCNRTMPPGAIAACSHNCGVWVNAETARESFVDAELAPSRLTTWFRERVACPHCSTRMTLRGYDMALFQGCDEHGFWVDDETVGQTGLARPWVAPQIQRARDAAKAMRAEEERVAAEEKARREAAERERLAKENSADAIRARREKEIADNRAAEQKAWRRAPFMKLLRELTANDDLIPLADYMAQLQETVDWLKLRVESLERGR